MSQQQKLRGDKIIVSPHNGALLKERPRVRFRRALFSFLVIMVILSAVYMTTPLSRLGVVYFEGLNMLTRSDLISLIDIDADELFLRIRLSDVQASVETHPNVKVANVSRAWINQIRIEVIEHEVAACALIEGEIFHILTDGEQLHESVGLLADCDTMMINGLTQSEIDDDVLSLFVRQLMSVDPEIKAMIQMIEHAPLYGNNYRFSLLMIDGNEVTVTAHTMAEQLNLYPVILVELLRHKRIEFGQTGILHLDVVPFFEPHE